MRFFFLTVHRGHEWVTVKWTQVVVGDIVKVCDGGFFPADLILLSSRSAFEMYRRQ